MESAREILVWLVLCTAIQQIKGATSTVSVSTDTMQPTPIATPMPETTMSTPCTEDAFFCNDYDPIVTGLHLGYIGAGGLGLIMICLGCVCMSCVKCCRNRRKSKYDVKQTEFEEGFILIPMGAQGNDYSKINPPTAVVIENNQAAQNDNSTPKRKSQDQPRGRLVSGPTVHTIKKKNPVDEQGTQPRQTSTSSDATHSPRESTVDGPPLPARNRYSSLPRGSTVDGPALPARNRYSGDSLPRRSTVDGPTLPVRNRSSRTSESSLLASPMKPLATGALAALLDSTEFSTSTNAAYGYVPAPEIVIKEEVYSEADVFENPAAVEEGIYDNEEPERDSDSESIYDNESLVGNDNIYDNEEPPNDDNIYDNGDPDATFTSTVTVNVATSPDILDQVPGEIERSRTPILPPPDIPDHIPRDIRRARSPTAPLPPPDIPDRPTRDTNRARAPTLPVPPPAIPDRPKRCSSPLPPIPIGGQYCYPEYNPRDIKRCRSPSIPLPRTPLEEQLFKGKSNTLAVPGMEVCKVGGYNEEEDIYEDTSDLISIESETTVENDDIYDDTALDENFYEDTVATQDTGIYEDVQELT